MLSSDCILTPPVADLSKHSELSKHGEPRTDKTRACDAQNTALQTQLSHMQISEAALMRSPADRDALKAIDEALAALKADMARESAEFLARLNDLLDLLDQCHQDAADGLLVAGSPPSHGMTAWEGYVAHKARCEPL
ncbi:hypothetical protein E8E11_000853 [Didymella keratinophila]|nr:hypothetical protein E8E11_000853 [Didymella keratinophila]